MEAAAPGAPWDRQRVFFRGRSVASNVHLRNSFFGLRRAANVLFPAASCSQSNVRERGSAISQLLSLIHI
eukprot:5433946-Prorocentrum_lima.AAC.1